MRSARSIVLIAVPLILTIPAWGQITSNEGDRVLNVPYRGTVDSLRQCMADLGHGEVKSHTEPLYGSLEITSSTIDVWVEGNWDRSVLRLFQGIDASGSEVDLTGTSELSPVTLSAGFDGFVRFSLKAIGTKSMAPHTFTIKFSYRLSSWTTVTRTFRVAPMTGADCSLPGESEAFHFGTPLLDVSVGNANLTVPVGRTAEMIGAAFIDKDRQLGPSSIQTTDVLLPGAAESLYIQNWGQFRLGGGSSGPNKTSYGTPWPGHLIGYYASGDVWGPDGTHFDSLTQTYTNGLRRFDRIRPVGLSEFHSATVNYVYDDSFNNRVIEINDQAATPNVITLHRTAGVVTRITTSDGRGWDIESDPTEGWITGIVPDSGMGARYFTYTTTPTDPEAAPRVARVEDADNNVMYEFAYQFDGDNVPVELIEEKRFVDGALQTIVEHEVVNEGLRRRKEYVGPGEFRQYDFAYDTGAVPNPLNHRLASVTSYADLNGAGTSYTTTFTHDVDNADGTMVITRVDLSDGTWIDHEYDSHIDTQTVRFGFRSKSTHSGPSDGALVTYDMDYEFFYTSGATTRLFHRPRVVKQRDGRGAASEVTFDYENGDEDENFDGLYGEDSNQLLKRTGPTITLGTSGARTPETRFTYDTTDRVLAHQETDYASGLHRVVEYDYDELLRLTSQTLDPGGENIVTEYQYVDNLPTQDRIVVDPDNYYTKTLFDDDGRVWKTQRFLTAGGASGNFYQTEYIHDTNGCLYEKHTDNKDQDGDPITGETNPLVTRYTYDRLGRLTQRTVDPDGIGQQSNYDYAWSGGIEQESDTSGRGSKRVCDGRGLTKEEIPLQAGAVEVPELKTTFVYDANGRLTETHRPTGGWQESVYDDFGRIDLQSRHPGLGGGYTISTDFDYDEASNVTRTYVSETDGRATYPLSDTTALYDEGGFNFESRQRIVTGVDSDSDPVAHREFDWAGNVTEEKSLGDSTVSDRTVATDYDGANRVERTTDSTGGETIFVRDNRGNVEQTQVKLNTRAYALADMQYDALSRVIQTTEPTDSVGLRHYRQRTYDSRGNLRRETAHDATRGAVQTTVHLYDAAGRMTEQATLADAGAFLNPPDPAVDRVADSEYDADGRLEQRKTYNNDVADELVTSTEYDGLGRIERVTDPCGSYTENLYDSVGRLDSRDRYDGYGLRTSSYGYDGHDRVTSQTAHGDGRSAPDLVTTFELDGLGRQIRITNPKGITSRTDYDLTGQRLAAVENEGGGALERQADFGYNRLNQLITQTAHNKTSAGTALDSQVTHYRYDTLDRTLRIVFPDSSEDPNDPGCVDCVKTQYDNAGRITQRTDQQGTVTGFEHDNRGLLWKRTTGSTLDTFGYDALGRIGLADRGTVGDPDAVSHVTRGYTDLGNLLYEEQTTAGGATYRVDYDHDQAGNRTELGYPGGATLDYSATPTNRMQDIQLDGAAFVDYAYTGCRLTGRRTTTDDPGGVVYDVRFGYDHHRRTSRIENRVETGAGTEDVALYWFEHDDNGNPISQIAHGLPEFTRDNRTFTVDDLDRLTQTDFEDTYRQESSAFDLLGNRESATNREDTTFTYGPVNPANEYADIDGNPLTYDNAGNLIVDEDGRQYFYDEQYRLIEIQDVGDVALARYTYDALGRRILAEFDPDDPEEAVTVAYTYDGQSVIEERDDAETLSRYHVNGGQYIDERVATYETAKRSESEPRPSGSGRADARAAGWTYYLLNANYSVAGRGNADGSQIERFNYASGGDWAGYDILPAVLRHDADEDGDVDLRDFANFQVCFDSTDPNDCLPYHDYDSGGNSDGVIDLADFEGLVHCFSAPDTAPPADCQTGRSRAAPPANDLFALHGRPVDILPDGKMLLYIRARYYDPKIGRWLQRDPTGYADGASLYESFRSNAQANTDPYGEEVWVEAREKRINRNGQELWAVEYYINENGVGLGLGAQIYLGWNWLFGDVPNSEIIETTYAGMEYFAYRDDPKARLQMITMVENQRQIIEMGYIANRDVANLRQGIIVLGTAAVALPVAHVVAPAAGATLGTTTVASSAASGAVTGGVSLGLGSAAGEALGGGDAKDVVQAGVKGAALGVVTGGILGSASRFDVHLAGPQRFTWVHPSTQLTASTATSGVSQARYFEYRALRLQGLRASEAHQTMKLFDAGVSGEYAFHFTTIRGARGIVSEEVLHAGRGMAGRGVYAGTTPTPSFLLKHTPYVGWGLGSRPVRIPIRLTPAQSIKYPAFPPKTILFPATESIPLVPEGF